MLDTSRCIREPCFGQNATDIIPHARHDVKATAGPTGIPGGPSRRRRRRTLRQLGHSRVSTAKIETMSRGRAEQFCPCFLEWLICFGDTAAASEVDAAMERRFSSSSKVLGEDASMTRG